MGISKRIAEGIEKMQAGDPEAALYQICSALEATARSFNRKRGGKSYRDGDSQRCLRW